MLPDSQLLKIVFAYLLKGKTCYVSVAGFQLESLLPLLLSAGRYGHVPRLTS